MGQPITVLEKPSSNPAILRLETNRPLTGMGHERYVEAPGELRNRPVDELARRLFATDEVEAVHVNGGIVTITLRGGRTGTGLADVARGLFRHYPDSPAPEASGPTDEADRTPESTEDTGDTPAAQQADPPAEAPPGEEPTPDTGAPEGEEPAPTEG
jgi:hypothetical protein